MTNLAKLTNFTWSFFQSSLFLFCLKGNNPHFFLSLYRDQLFFGLLLLNDSTFLEFWGIFDIDGNDIFDDGIYFEWTI